MLLQELFPKKFHPKTPNAKDLTPIHKGRSSVKNAGAKNLRVLDRDDLLRIVDADVKPFPCMGYVVNRVKCACGKHHR